MYLQRTTKRVWTKISKLWRKGGDGDGRGETLNINQNNECGEFLNSHAMVKVTDFEKDNNKWASLIWNSWKG